MLEDAEAAGFERFVLVGHSLGGLTLTTVANRAPERLARLVYVAALAPPPGRTVFDLLAPDQAGADPAGTQDVLPGELARAMFAADLDDETWAAAEARLVPEPTGLFVEPVLGYEHGVPTTYVRCTRDAVSPTRWSARFLPHLHPEELLELDSDHDAMLSHPADLAAPPRRDHGPQLSAPVRRAQPACVGPPAVEAPVGLLLAEGALLQAQLEEEVERPPHLGTGRQAQVRHHLVAVEVGPDGGQLLAGLQVGDARPRARPCGATAPGPCARCGWCSRSG